MSHASHEVPTTIKANFSATGEGAATLESPTQEETTPEGSKDPASPPREIGGRGGLEPTRYGDWEKAGRCIDF